MSRELLPDAATDLLDGRDARFSEWATASALAMYALAAGLDEDAFVDVVIGTDFAETFATENGRDRSDRLESRLRKAYSHAEDDFEEPLGDVESVRAGLARLSGRIERYRWTGRTAHTDRAVALSVVAYGHERGAWTFDMSVREVAERACVGKTTAGRASVRLVAKGLLRRGTSPVRPDDAQAWELNLAWERNGTHKPLPPVNEIMCPDSLSTVTTHPAFLRSALGATAGQVWLGMEHDEWLPAKAVADRFGIHVTTARTTLVRLVDNGLAERQQNGRTALFRIVTVDGAFLDRIAKEYGTDDWSARQREQHDRDRAGYGTALFLKATDDERRRDEVEAMATA